MTQPREPLSSYQRKLFVFLGVATFFEGFEYAAISQLLPALRDDFALDRGGAGLLLGALNVGSLLAYLLIRRADRVGRRPILSLTIVGYTVFSVATALSQSALFFGAVQVVARAFLVAEYVISMLYVAEDFPATRRAFAAGVMQCINTFGHIVCVGLVPVMLKTPLGWRGIYLVGALPLIALAIARRSVGETKRFAELAARGEQGSGDLFRLWRSPYRGRMLLMSAVWSLTYLCVGIAVSVWKDFALRERGLSEEQAAQAMGIAAVVSLPMVYFSGKLLDWVGRRRGAAAIFLTTSFSTVAAFSLHGFAPLTAALILAIFAASAVLPVLTTITMELFPTELRGDGFAWSNNLLGRVGFIASPPLVGLLAERVGWGPAVSSTALFPLVALSLVLLKVRETKGQELEETSRL